MFGCTLLCLYLLLGTHVRTAFKGCCLFLKVVKNNSISMSNPWKQTKFNNTNGLNLFPFYMIVKTSSFILLYPRTQKSSVLTQFAPFLQLCLSTMATNASDQYIRSTCDRAAKILFALNIRNIHRYSRDVMNFCGSPVTTPYKAMQ